MKDKASNVAVAPKNFRLFLRDELAKRAHENPKYSLRDFAKDLRVDSSALSKMLSGKRVMGHKIITKLAQRLGLGPQDIASFIAGTVKSKTRSSYEMAADFGQLDQDVYEFYAHWPNYALHALLRSKEFRLDKKWIAKKLGLNVNEVSAMLERFERLGILKIDGEEFELRTSTVTTLERDVADAPRQMQLELLTTAHKKLASLPLEKRDFSTVVFRMDEKQLKLAKEMILEFRRNLVDLMSTKAKGSDVYALSINLFPLTEEE